MIASLESSLLTLLFLSGFVVAGAMAVVILPIALLVRHCHRDYKKQGGAKVVIPKVVGGTAAKIAGRALRRRFFG